LEKKSKQSQRRQLLGQDAENNLQKSEIVSGRTATGVPNPKSAMGFWVTPPRGSDFQTVCVAWWAPTPCQASWRWFRPPILALSKHLRAAPPSNGFVFGAMDRENKNAQ